MKKALTKIFNVTFSLGLLSFLLTGMVMVFGQMFAVFSMNGPLSVFLGTLKHFAIRSAAVAGFSGFLLSYVNPKKAFKAKKAE